MKHRYVIELDDSNPFNPFFDPREGVTIVAFTRSEQVSELQAASDEGFISGDFAVAEVLTTAHDPSIELDLDLTRAIERIAIEPGGIETALADISNELGLDK